MNKKKKQVHSFRIDEKTLGILQFEADEHGTTLNALANKIFQEYVKSGRWDKRFNMLKMRRLLLSRIIACCPPDAIINSAKTAGSIETKDALRTIGLVPNYENVLYYIENNLARSANWFNFSFHKRGSKDMIHLGHDLGYKWSLFVAHIVATIFQEILNKEANIEIFENCATIEVTP